MGIRENLARGIPFSLPGAHIPEFLRGRLDGNIPFPGLGPNEATRNTQEHLGGYTGHVALVGSLVDVDLLDTESTPPEIISIADTLHQHKVVTPDSLVNLRSLIADTELQEPGRHSLIADMLQEALIERHGIDARIDEEPVRVPNHADLDHPDVVYRVIDEALNGLEKRTQANGGRSSPDNSELSLVMVANASFIARFLRHFHPVEMDKGVVVLYEVGDKPKDNLWTPIRLAIPKQSYRVPRSKRKGSKRKQ